MRTSLFRSLMYSSLRENDNERISSGRSASAAKEERTPRKFSSDSRRSTRSGNARLIFLSAPSHRTRRSSDVYPAIHASDGVGAGFSSTSSWSIRKKPSLRARLPARSSSNPRSKAVIDSGTFLFSFQSRADSAREPVASARRSSRTCSIAAVVPIFLLLYAQQWAVSNRARLTFAWHTWHHHAPPRQIDKPCALQP